MIRVDNRESAHIRSRVKDLSVVPNIASFNALLACITPIAKLKKNADTNSYEPILVRDNETLIANFGDPRIDPEKYIDLYSVMQVVGNGGTCYVAKVDSGETGVYQFPLLADPNYQDVSENEPIKLDKSESDDRVYTATLKNKCVITGLRGYNNDSYADGDAIFTAPFDVLNPDEELSPSPEDQALPDGEYTDYSGKYTWECKLNDSGDYTLTITLFEALQEGKVLVAISKIDPNWGAEPLIFKPAENPISNDGDNKVSYVTFESDSDVENAYVIIKFSDESGYELPEKLNGAIYDTELVGKTLKLTFTVPYTAPEPSGTPAPSINLNDIKDVELKAEEATRKSHSLIAYSSMSDDLTFDVTMTQAKPYSIKAYYLNISVFNNEGANNLGSAKIKLESTTTNQGLVNALNSALGTIVRFELMDPNTAAACGVKERGANSIVQALLDKYVKGDKMEPNPASLVQPIMIERPTFEVDVNNYIEALEQYKEKKYVGCLMADMVCPVTKDSDDADHELYPLSADDRRTLHYHMKEIARERKDTTVLLSTPYTQSVDNKTAFDINEACDWVASLGSYSDLWEYGQGATTDYATQSFYLEIYYSWLEMQCDWIVNGAAKAKSVKVAPANIVLNNVLTSWRERGIQYPVAGDQGGVLPETCKVLMNPKTKLERDQLVQYRINPIWDTGTRGVQIFGNETLNAGYTDLNAAHIARLLVYIRSQIDEYTERLKFSINSMPLWDKWKAHVSQRILEPLMSSNALKEYRVSMGTDTTSPEEIANRQINGRVQLVFYASAEIFDLEYTVYSTSTTIDEAMGNV